MKSHMQENIEESPQTYKKLQEYHSKLLERIRYINDFLQQKGTARGNPGLLLDHLLNQ